ncbi:MAG TPA: peptidoglycan-binding protein [Ornithinimicrobium sp.]|uniref:peptidoglycan-binding domain-containing protein n=1 Tax=Ornithinimicrobium sp. TaxID=1977084 RepID=UPI002B46F4C4|nr:peptidoglycan-binding protein [Ornithinimicrobium sp.]HKJ11435.1 peptidoglycan-binding protein [Ornithinimicrobium sp.]
MPAPPKSTTLPDEVDAETPYQRNAVCDPVDKPGLEAFANLIGEHYNRPAYSTSRACIDQKSDHYDGRAIDWTLDAGNPADRRIGDAVVTWLTDNDGEMARRFGIQSIIWNAHSWRPGGGGWQGYVGQSAHTDHVHFSFTWDGAMMRTSWWTGVAVEEIDHGPCSVVAGQYAAVPVAPNREPCPATVVSAPQTDYASVRPEESGRGVGLVQPLLEVPQTGTLDHSTREALMRWQTQAGIPQTGVLDQLTYAAAQGRELPEIPQAALAVPREDHMRTAYSRHHRAVLAAGSSGPAVEVLQRGLGIEPDGQFGPQTEQALKDFTTDHPLLTENTETTALLWHVLELRDHPTLAYRHLTLRTGDSGAPVAMVQELVGAEPDGEFGSQTEQAVRQAQSEAGLEPTGVVNGPTWAALDPGREKVAAIQDLRGGRIAPSSVRD